MIWFTRQREKSSCLDKWISYILRKNEQSAIKRSCLSVYIEKREKKILVVVGVASPLFSKYNIQILSLLREFLSFILERPFLHVQR